MKYKKKGASSLLVYRFGGRVVAHPLPTTALSRLSNIIDR